MPVQATKFEDPRNPEVPRTSQIPRNPENDIHETTFPPKLRRIPNATRKTFHNVSPTTGAIFTSEAKNLGCAQGK